MKRWIALAVAGSVVAGIAACGSDSLEPLLDRGGSTAHSITSGLSLTPHRLTLPLGFYGHISALARDSAGITVLKPVSWRSSNAAMVTVGDTGLIYGKSVGSATVYATVDGITDSAMVSIVPATASPIDSTPTDTVPPPTVVAPVSSFELHVVAKGLNGADTTKSELVAGATVTLLRTGGVNGDTLSTPEPAGTAVTGANGEATFAHLAGGSYTIHVAPPAGSPYRAAERAIAPPRYSSIYVSVSMQPR